MAWLAATPEKGKKPRHVTMKGSAMTEIQPQPEAVGWVAMASECGLSSVAGMGSITPSSWHDIHAWQSATGQEGYLIAQTMRQLSEAYVKEYYDAAEPTRLSPLQDTIDENEKRKAVVQQFKNFVRKRK